MQSKLIFPTTESQLLWRQSLALLVGSDEPLLERHIPRPKTLAKNASHLLENHPNFLLMQEVFRLAINAALSYVKVRTSWAYLSSDVRNDVLEGLAWVIATDTMWPYSLHKITEFLHLDSEEIRKKILTRIKMKREDIVALLEREGWDCTPAHPIKRKRARRRRPTYVNKQL